MRVPKSLIKLLLDRQNLTAFQKKVLLETYELGWRETSTYKKIAVRIGKPRAYRAVGNALNKNPYPVLIPCHKVLGTNDIGGYGHGALAKRVLIAIEGAKT